MVIFAVLQNVLFTPPLVSQLVSVHKMILFVMKIASLFYFSIYLFMTNNKLGNRCYYIGMDACITKRLHLWLNWFLYLQIRSNELNNEIKKRGGGFSKLCSLSPTSGIFGGPGTGQNWGISRRLWWIFFCFVLC